MTKKQRRTTRTNPTPGIKTPDELRNAIETLQVKTPIADQFEKDLVRLKKSDKDRRWYTTQKEHWLGCLAEYAGPGYYGRQESAKRTAEHVFNRIMNPAMILWLIDASGVAREVVESAKQAALEAKSSYASQCGAIRRVAPWNLVLQALIGSRQKAERGEIHSGSAKVGSRFLDRTGGAARKNILNRDSRTCQACKGLGQNLEVHHKFPVELGGTDVAENLITICVSCHKLVHRFGDRARNWNDLRGHLKLTTDAMRVFENATEAHARVRTLALAAEIAAAKAAFPKSTAEVATYRDSGFFQGIVSLTTACKRVMGRNKHLRSLLAEADIGHAVAKVWHFTPIDVRPDCSIAMAHRGQTLAINHRNHLLMRIPARRDLGRTTTVPALFLLATLDGPLSRRFDLAFDRYALFDACMVCIDFADLGSLTDAEWRDYAAACELARSAQRTRGRRSNVDPGTIPSLPSR